ncbi:MAG: MopE-related protein [Pseudomonadota bacterium]|nr:MopE-related protein [Pseudomonadota bacterium]
MKSLTLSLLALFAVACTDKGAEDTGVASTDDMDEDGYSAAEGDCDDGDMYVNPGQSETWYDGIDQDCDGNDSDQDLDGFLVGDDCDDRDAAVNPDGSEVCDEVDNDCDGLVDIGASDSQIAFVDADLDGHGAAGGEAAYCGEIPAGYAAVDDDCDDAQPTVYPGAEEVCDDLDNDCDGEVNEGNPDEVPYYRDADGDSFGNAADSLVSCRTPDDFVADATDCDDTSAEVNPAADELCDELDRDCDGNSANDAVDGTPYYSDLDGDAYGDPATELRACDVVEGLVADGTDCDDTSAAVHPGGVEVCDGLDNDCSSAADDGLVFSDWYADVDADGFGDPTVASSACDQPEGYVEDATDCDDADAATFVGAAELCDLEDNDCDGAVDDGAVDERTYYDDADSDGYGNSELSVSSCGLPSGYAETGDDCDDANSVIHPGATETCNGLDDDCEGSVDQDAADATTWYADADTDGYGNPAVATASCRSVRGYVTNAEDCDDASAAHSPADAEVCDGADNNCDGTVDEDGATGASTWYADADADGFGRDDASLPACALPAGYAALAGDCDDGAASVNPGAAEACNDLDDDCDTAVDEAGASGETPWYVDLDGDGFGSSSVTELACHMPDGYTDDATDCDDADATSFPSAPEADDLADNDCDGLVDEDFIGLGDVIITEVTRQPRFGAAAVNNNGHWFELYNNSAREIDLSNWYMSRYSGSGSRDGFYVDPAAGLLIGAGEYAVFCKTDLYTAAATAYSTLVCDYTWGDASEASTYAGTYHDNTFSLQRDEDILSVWFGGDVTTGMLVDDVHWAYDATDGYWPRDATRSLSLDPDFLDGTDNDVITHWCSTTNTSAYRWYYASSASVEYGTPGAANYDCP